MASELKNVAGWRLNAAEKDELQKRVAAGEDEATVKRELQTAKAQASLDRKKAADAVANRCVAQAKQAAKAKAKGKAAAQPALPPLQLSEQDKQINKEYYSQVQADLHRILTEFGSNFVDEMPVSISADTDGRGHSSGGVQEPYNKDKAQTALSAHGIYRCAVSAWWFNPLCSATPGVPLTRRRVEELSEFSFGSEGNPRFHTDRMIEVGINTDEVKTDRPTNLQMVSPEELLHATLAGCVRAITSCSQMIVSRTYFKREHFLLFFF